MDADIYGITPSANMEKFPREPPFITLKNSKNPEAARKFVDFILGKDAQELMTSIDFTVPVNSEAKVIDGATRIEDVDLIDYDREKAAAQKKEVLAAWSKILK